MDEKKEEFRGLFVNRFPHGFVEQALAMVALGVESAQNELKEYERRRKRAEDEYDIRRLLRHLQDAGDSIIRGGTLKKCVNGQAVYPLSEQDGLKAQERRYTAHEEGKH